MGVAKCYAFSSLQENVGLGNLPAIWHVKCTDAVMVDEQPLGDFRSVGAAPYRFQKIHSDLMGGRTLAAGASFLVTRQ